jgi:hypothetical protein
MIPLEHSRWSELQHAYGNAADIPALLRRLENFPAEGGEREPWFTLWSSLCHQGDVFDASFAAVPHIIRILATAPEQATPSFFQLPACIEIARDQNKTPIPRELSDDYFTALHSLPKLVGAASTRPWSDDLLCSALAAVAAAKGFHLVAKTNLELDSTTANQFLEWLENQ